VEIFGIETFLGLEVCLLEPFLVPQELDLGTKENIKEE
jgi:hypothetical protein